MYLSIIIEYVNDNTKNVHNTGGVEEDGTYSDGWGRGTGISVLWDIYRWWPGGRMILCGDKADIGGGRVGAGGDCLPPEGHQTAGEEGGSGQ